MISPGYSLAQDGTALATRPRLCSGIQNEIFRPGSAYKIAPIELLLIRVTDSGPVARARDRLINTNDYISANSVRQASQACANFLRSFCRAGHAMVRLAGLELITVFVANALGARVAPAN